MGVRRAMEMVLAAANKHEGRLYTYGPLIHNRQVLELLESKNVRAIDDINGIRNGTILIRAHGIPPHQRKQLKSSGLKIIDATCPRVAKVQSVIRYNTKKGLVPVIVGDKDHSEVIGLMGYGNGRAIIIDSKYDVPKLPEGERIFVVAQTTQNIKVYDEITGAIKERFTDAVILDTICEATSQRQDEVKSLAEHVDGVVVVGGYHSANTQRLAQVSRETGTPTFHIETEKELAKDQLTSMEVIGVTAGASTPNWMIKNVVKEIEAIHGKGETVIGRRIKQIFKFLLLSNFLVALGAFSLSHAAIMLAGRKPDIIHPLLAFFYIYAMHVLNRFLDKGASMYNDPERASFYEKHRIFLICTSVISVVGALTLSLYLGTRVFLAIAGFSLLGVIYGITIVPKNLRHLLKYSKLKDIPGSKTLLEALAWAVVITFLPLLDTFSIEWPVVVVSFIIVFSIAFVRSAFYDIFQAQGDLIVGTETIPITLGEKKTIVILKWMIVSTALLLVITSLINIIDVFAILLLTCFLTLSLCLTFYENRRIYPGPLLEFLIEGNLYLAGIIGLIWQILT